jgi:hypothetical protein
MATALPAADRVGPLTAPGVPTLGPRRSEEDHART